MSRLVKCAHIQASNARHDGTPAEIKEAMIQKHIPLIEEAGEKAFRFSACRKSFTGPIFAPNRILNGTRRLRRYRAQRWNGLPNTAKKMPHGNDNSDL